MIKNNKIVYYMIMLIFIISCKSKDTSYYINNEKMKNEKSGVYYEIFVRSFADSNGDGIGDIKGIMLKLDKLKELGIEGIWLTPIFKSPSYHKYDVTDYYKIDPEYGTSDDLKNLVIEANKRGIKIILDLPVNHTSVEHPWFKDIKDNVNSKYKEYYRISKKDDKSLNLKSFSMGHLSWVPLNDKELYYAIFWEGMPDLNFSNKKVRKEIIDIGKYWIINSNIDGYRLDAAYHIYGKGEYPEKIDSQTENLSWWNEFRKNMQSVKPNVYLVGEVWSSTSQTASYFNVFDSNFNFDISEKGIIEAISSGDGEIFGKRLSSIYNQYYSVAENYIDAPFLTNHDQNRLANTISDLKQQKLASSILLTLPGNPFIYYGEELGMKGSKPDEEIREPYLWDENDNSKTHWIDNKNNKIGIENYNIQHENKNSLYNHYKLLLNLRKNNEILKYGNYKFVDLNNPKILAYERTYNKKSIIIIHNMSSENINVDLVKKINYYKILSLHDIENGKLNIAGYTTAIFSIN